MYSKFFITRLKRIKSDIVKKPLKISWIRNQHTVKPLLMYAGDKGLNQSRIIDA